MTTSKNETKYNKVVNIAEDGEITVLDYTFKHSDGFKGATGSKFYPVSQTEYDEQTERDNVIDYLIDIGMELPENFKRGGFNELYEAMLSGGEVEQCIFDTSYSELWDYLRQECGLSEDDAVIFNCVGGGRCFDKHFEGNVNTELSAIIREFES